MADGLVDSLDRCAQTTADLHKSSGDLGIENVPIELPATLNPLNDEDFAIAFTAGRFLPFGHDCSMRASPNEPKVVAQFHLQQIELNIEVQF
jgi:hypothetical protein